MHRNAALHEFDAHHVNRGASHLPSVITSKYSRGLGSLHRIYAPYFRIPLADLVLTRQISYQKQWFLLILTGREADHPTFTDDVIGNPAFRRWIGLLPCHQHLLTFSSFYSVMPHLRDSRVPSQFEHALFIIDLPLVRIQP